MNDKKYEFDTLAKLLSEERKGIPAGKLPHDAMNKAVFAHAEMLKSFLLHYVDESFIRDLDFTSIESLPTEFVSESMRKRYSDCIKKIRWKGNDAYLLLILEFQSTKDIWIPVRILAYTALLWLDLIKKDLVTKKEGLPPIFPIVVYSGEEKWNDPLSVQKLLSPAAKLLLKFQPSNFALLVEERTIKNEVLQENSDFYAMYVELKRSKTPMAMRDVIRKYKQKLSNPENYELLKTILAILETLYCQFNKDFTDSDVHFESIEEAVKMIESTGIDWKKNTQEYYLNEFKNEERKAEKRRTALAMLREGLSLKLIGKITELPLEEIDKLKEKIIK